MRKKLSKTQPILALFIAGLCLICSPLNLIATDDGQNNQELPDDFREKFRASKEKVVTGYRIEQFGWAGAPFSRMVKEYEWQACCDYTGNPMDGCSGVPNCSRK